MDALLFTKMLSDPYVTDLRKLGYQYPQADMAEFISLLKDGFYKYVPLKDFNGGSWCIWRASPRCASLPPGYS